jgi:hypothetical protein
MQKIFIYHYCCQYQKNIGRIEYIDGIVRTPNEIKNMSDYTNLKSLINSEFESTLIITNLSLLGTEMKRLDKN